MSCNCSDSGNMGNGSDIRSWNDFATLCPRSPLTVIAWAKIDNSIGVFKNSSTFINPPSGTWTPDTTRISGLPVCTARGTDNQQMVADAADWNFKYLTWNNSLLLSPVLQKLIFLRGGTQWKMSVPFTNTNSALEIQLSFRNNAATRGDAQGTIPVIEFAGPFDPGAHTLELVVVTIGQTSMALRFNIDGNNYSMYESEWWITS